MKTLKQYEEEQERLCRDWFTKHVALESEWMQLPMEKRKTLRTIDWREPDTGIFAVRYMIDGRRLIVTGDIGCAVFSWSEPITFEFVNGCGLGYFSEKCEASEEGRSFTDWQEDVAKYHIDWIAKDIKEAGEDESKLAGIDYSTKEDCNNWLRSNYEDIGIDSETASNIASSGIVPHPRCIGMWVGFKMAYEQLRGAA